MDGCRRWTDEQKMGELMDGEWKVSELMGGRGGGWWEDGQTDGG